MSPKIKEFTHCLNDDGIAASTFPVVAEVTCQLLEESDSDGRDLFSSLSLFLSLSKRKKAK